MAVPDIAQEIEGTAPTGPRNGSTAMKQIAILSLALTLFSTSLAVGKPAVEVDIPLCAKAVLKDVASISDFINPMTGQPAPYPTVIDLCRNAVGLRLKITATEPDQMINASPMATPDRIQNGDYVAVAFTLDPKATESYIFFVDPRGQKAALSSVDPHYNPNWLANCSHGSSSWSCDLVIPYDAFIGVDRAVAAPRIAFIRHMKREPMGYWYWPNISPVKPLNPSSEAPIKQLFPGSR